MIVIAKLSSFVLRRFWPTDKAKLLASTLAVQTFTTERCSSQNRQTIKRFIWNMRMVVYILTICCSNNTIKYLISNALYNKNDKPLWMTAITENQKCFLQYILPMKILEIPIITCLWTQLYSEVKIQFHVLLNNSQSIKPLYQTVT